ncbi:hypothetical protein OAA39_00440 [bacterium]|nr:hypothetical protein [bacterium]
MTKTVTTGKATDLITFTRSTTGTYLDSVKYGDELVTNGTFDSTTGWTGDGATILSAADNKLLVTNGDNTPAYAVQYIDTVVGESYSFTADLISTSGSLARMLVSGGVIDTGATLSEGTNTIIWTATLTSHAIFVANGANVSTGDVVTWSNVSVKQIIGNQGTSGEPLLRTANTNEPRIEYDADGNLKGLLIEEQRTNKLTYSQDFTLGWLQEQLTIATAPVAAPDGTMTATHAVRTGSAGTGHLVRTNVVTTSDRHSIWARTVSGTGTMYIAFHDSDTYKVTLTEKWQRFDVQCNNNHVYAVNFRGSATLTECYIWGSQAETGSFPTSYIPTSGSTATRNADIANVNPSTFELNQNESTLLVSGTSMPTRGVGTVKEFWCASLHTASGYANMRFYSGGVANSAVQDAVGFDGGVQFDATGATVSPPVEFTSVLAIKDNDVGYANQSMTGVFLVRFFIPYVVQSNLWLLPINKDRYTYWVCDA